ncbi:MAG: DUF1624 domain-containing protein [Thermotogae bacterium]|nr:DUF1624 domain-containing protein [Thermotogota bacterium]
MSKKRLLFFDYLKGLFVIWMIPTHTLDGVIVPSIKATPLYQSVAFFNGLVAPAFLVSSGFLAVYTYNHGKFLRRLRRGIELMAFGYATQLPTKSLLLLVTLTLAFVLSSLGISPPPPLPDSPPEWFVRGLHVFRRVEILISIGSGVLVITAILRYVESFRVRFILFTLLAFLFWGLAPKVWEMGKALPMFIAPYFTREGSLFPVFPYWGFMFFGSALGSSYHMDRRVTLALMLVPLAALALTVFVPPPPSEASVYNSLVRTGVLMVVLFVLITAESFGFRSEFLAMLGRNSLMSYAFHNAIVYGSPFTKPLAHFYGHRGWLESLFLGAMIFAVTVLFIKVWEDLRNAHGPRFGRSVWTFFVLTFALMPW